ncbi:hypothetical protein M8C21_001641 [Ambrosia artemisiifolia]|uniref:USP domain-containing protein n=1 Tax=Ambrosia artemisiifolia TaxID=4212 RepID=A0AAD5GUK8_AMBAR|nr:hypothetical protein M8C21_001641 [Ambrosia artemisiifolia]
MGDSAGTLPAPTESVGLFTELIESVSCPKSSSSLPTQTLDPEDFSLSELKKELDIDSLLSTELLEDCDGPVLYPSGSEANITTLSEPLTVFNNNFVNVDGESVSCNRSRFEVHDKPSVASSSFSWQDDGFDNPSTVGAGLANLGNTCFFNAVLQCFTHSVLLVQGLYSQTHPTPCDSSNERFCLICVLREHIELSLSSSGKIVYPWKFIDSLSYFSSSFQRYQQEDAHEFLQCFLDRLESSLSILKTKDDGHSETDNLVKQVFGGRVISKLRCCNCSHISDTYEPFADLSLEIDDVNSLSTALQSFTKVEQIGDEEMRFKNDGSHVEKIDKHVDFPLELDLQSYTCGSLSNDMDLKYELYAVVVHAAFTSSCGHYYCYIRSAPDTWYKFDDLKVTRVSEDIVLSEEAYILFYAKQGTPWFSSFMETYKPSFYPNLPTTSPKSVLENLDPPSVHSDGIKAPIDHHHDPQSGYVVPLKPVINVTKETFPLGLKEYGSNHRTEAQKNTCVSPKNDSKRKIYIDELVSPLTQPRSPGPDTSDDKISEVVFAAKPKKSKLVEKATCKRQRNNELENPAKHEAMRMCKRMPGARGELLMAAMSSKSEHSRKSKKMTSSPRKNISKSHDRFISVSRKLGRFSFP